MLTDSLRGHISSFRQSSKYPPLIYGVRHCLKLNCERNSPEAAHARLNWALNPLQLHKAGCEEVAQPPTTFHFTTIFTCTYCLYNKNANQGGQSMWDGNRGWPWIALASLPWAGGGVMVIWLGKQVGIILEEREREQGWEQRLKTKKQLWK